MFTVSGEGKAEILNDFLKNPDKTLYPSQRVQPENGRLLWIIDKAAAKLL
jgi:6-phosphogluconolactonase